MSEKCFIKGCKNTWRYKSRNYRIACCEKHFQDFCTEIIKQLSKWDFEINLNETEQEKRDKKLAVTLAIESVRLKGQLKIIDNQLNKLNKKRRRKNE